MLMSFIQKKINFEEIIDRVDGARLLYEAGHINSAEKVLKELAEDLLHDFDNLKD